MNNDTVDFSASSIGWIGVGRMGAAMARRLLAGGKTVQLWNRTRSKAEALESDGATVADTPADLAAHPIVITMVSTGKDLEQVLFGESGLLTGERLPQLLIDSSTVDLDEAAQIRQRVTDLGVGMLAAPVSGNAKVVESGKLTMAVSGPQELFDSVIDLLELIAMEVTYVGDEELARLVKICHNLFLGVVTQSLAEITVLAEKGGVKRAAFLDFINSSVMGSVFTRYKSPAFVNLDFTPTFTPVLLRKDFELGLAASRALDAPLPVAALTHQIVCGLIGRGHVTDDFATLLKVQAESAGLTLQAEDTAVDDGLAH